MAAVTICSDFGAQENKICHCFHIFCLPWSDGAWCLDLNFFFNVEFYDSMKNKALETEKRSVVVSLWVMG